MRGLRAICAGAALFAIAGCDATGLVAAYQLRGVDFQTTDAAALRVAVVVPERFKPRTEEVRLTALVRMSPSETEDEAQFDMRLSPVTPGPEEQRIIASLDEGEAFYAYRIAPKDLPRFEMFRRMVGVAKAQDGSGSLGLDTPVCRVGTDRDAPIPVRSYLRAAETRTYVLLAQIDDLRDEAEEVELETVLPRCAD